jgi:ferredoxin
MAVTAVWIEEGCIVCNACETACPEVFKVTEDSCVILPEVRADAQEDMNNEAKSPLKDQLGDELADAIEEAAEGCPVEVIHFTTTD